MVRWQALARLGALIAGLSSPDILAQDIECTEPIISKKEKDGKVLWIEKTKTCSYVIEDKDLLCTSVHTLREEQVPGGEPGTFTTTQLIGDPKCRPLTSEEKKKRAKEKEHRL